MSYSRRAALVPDSSFSSLFRSCTKSLAVNSAGEEDSNKCDHERTQTHKLGDQCLVHPSRCMGGFVFRVALIQAQSLCTEVQALCLPLWSIHCNQFRKSISYVR